MLNTLGTSNPSQKDKGFKDFKTMNDKTGSLVFGMTIKFTPCFCLYLLYVFLGRITLTNLIHFYR